MTITHPQLVLALAKSGESILNEMNATQAHCLHMAVGISGEVAEIFEVLNRPAIDDQFMTDLLEETGDLEFYLEGLRQGLGLSRYPVVETEMRLASLETHQLILLAGDILDAVKKYAIYCKPANLELLQALMKRMDYALWVVTEHYGLSREHILAHNIAKLSKRYSSGSYSNTQAQVRADKGEAQ